MLSCLWSDKAISIRFAAGAFGVAFLSAFSAEGAISFSYYTLGKTGNLAPEPGGYQIACGGQVTGHTSSGPPVANHAYLWSEASTDGLDLTPSLFSSTTVNGTIGTNQVGEGYGIATANKTHALLWAGSAASVVDLNPTGSLTSSAIGAFKNKQVGSASKVVSGGVTQTHAIMWSGSADSAVDVHPIGFSSSYAIGTDGSQIVGFGRIGNSNTPQHALYWNNSATSAVDLHPAGLVESQANSVAGTQQVGWASDATFVPHAMLWNGTAASALDLNPAGFGSSVACATDGVVQVGYGAALGNKSHAMIWSGSAESYVDLHAGLPAEFLYSSAYSIVGNTIFGVARNASGSTHYGVTWTIVPEPASAAFLGIGTICLLRSRRRR